MVARLAYLGTPQIAVPPLQALVEAGHEVVIVVTRPDRRRGRGPAVSPSPVKAAAEALGLEVTDDLHAVALAGVERAVVVAYGRIIPVRLLEAVPMLNLHFSLLPRWRGAAPVERAILAGDQVTGVCVMEVEEGLDTGPVYAREEVVIGPDDTLDSLRDRLVAVGSRLLVEVLAAPLPEPKPQEGEPTYAEKISSADLELRWNRPGGELLRVVRLGRAWTTFRDRRLRVLKAEVVGAAKPAGPGSLEGDKVVTGDGALRLLEVQPEGKGPMAAADWLRGARSEPGERLRLGSGGMGAGEIKVAPSVLSADFGELAKAVGDVAGVADWLHIDVMDAHFVPNLTLGPPVISSMRKHSGMYFDCHLMMTDPGDYLEAFRDAGADGCTVHVEVGRTSELIARMHGLGLRAGLAANPDTPFEALEPYLDQVDLVLCMTVFPGFGGQKFMAEVLPKVAQVRKALEERGLASRVDIEVDGGIDRTTAPPAASAGANVFVAGSAIFGHERPWESVETIRQAALGE